MFRISRYFDHAATTPLRKEAFAAMKPYWMNEFGNPESLHQFGLQAKEALEAARETIAETIGARSKEIIFTGSGTESNNLAVLGAARRIRKLGKGSHIVTSGIEHPSVREACLGLAEEGFRVTVVPVDEKGRVNTAEVERAIQDDTVLISIMHANNVTGTIQPIAAIADIARKKGVLFHTDAVQSYGKIPVDVEELKADLMTINAHKIGGPKGVAALYIRRAVRIDPIVRGGGQERGLRSATHNLPGIVGFAKAAELAIQDLQREKERIRGLRNLLRDRVLSTIPGCKINGHETECLPTHLNISIDRIEGQALMLELDRLGFATSSGSACSSTDSEPSYVLLEMGKSREVALESLRISMGRTTTEQSVSDLADALAKVAAGWRSALNIPPVR